MRAVLAAPHEAERERTRWEPEGRDGIPMLTAGVARPRPLIEVARVAHFARHVGRERIFAHGIVHGRVAVHPHGVVVAAHRLVVLRACPLALQRDGIVEHVAQSKHEPCPALGSQRFQGEIQLAECAAGHVVDDQDIGRKCVQRGGGRARAHAHQIVQGDVEMTRAVLPAQVLP